MAQGDKKRGRVTPRKGSPPPPAATSGGVTGPRRRSILPSRVGPFSRPDPSAPLGQVGRRPTRPILLFAYALVYLACGIAAFFVLHGSLGVIIGVVLIGVSLLWLRGASTALLRQQAHREERKG